MHEVEFPCLCYRPVHQLPIHQQCIELTVVFGCTNELWFVNFVVGVCFFLEGLLGGKTHGIWGLHCDIVIVDRIDRLSQIDMDLTSGRENMFGWELSQWRSWHIIGDGVGEEEKPYPNVHLQHFNYNNHYNNYPLTLILTSILSNLFMQKIFFIENLWSLFT